MIKKVLSHCGNIDINMERENVFPLYNPSYYIMNPSYYIIRRVWGEDGGRRRMFSGFRHK